MQPQKIWTINRPLEAGENLTFNGTVIIKCFVPDFVRIDVENGGILLEAGGGNNLTLTTRENVETLATENVPDIAESIFRSVFNRERLYTQHSGILSRKHLGDNAILTSERSIKLSNVGENAVIRTPYSLDAYDIGRGAHIEAGKDIDAIEIAANTRATAGGVIDANNIGAYCHMDADGYICSQNIGAGSVLRSGDFIRGNQVGENVILISNKRVSLSGFSNNVQIIDGGITKLRTTDDVFGAGHGYTGANTGIRLMMN